MNIGPTLKSLRIGAGLSTVQVAERLHISESTYRKYETDRNSPTLDVLDEIADIYDRKVIDILPSQSVHQDSELYLLEHVDKIEVQMTDLKVQLDTLIRLNNSIKQSLNAHK